MDNSNTDELAKILWDYNNLNQPVKKSDAILVLGSNDIRVAERGAELFLQGFAPYISLSGNVGRLSKDTFNKPEAEIFADVSVKMGVPQDKIIIENKSINTEENIIFTRNLLKEKGLSFNSFIVVQKPYMGRRAYATFKKQWPDVDIIVTAPQISFEEYPNDLLSKDHIINISVGDTQRVKLYPQKGFQIKQEMPDDVWEAFEELVRRGYTEHLIKDD